MNVQIMGDLRQQLCLRGRRCDERGIGRDRDLRSVHRGDLGDLP
jgi:hypothetical protein